MRDFDFSPRAWRRVSGFAAALSEMSCQSAFRVPLPEAVVPSDPSPCRCPTPLALSRNGGRMKAVGQLVVLSMGIVITVFSSPPLAAQNAPSISGLRIIDNTRMSMEECSARHVAKRLAQLFEALSQGDPDVAEEFFGHGRGAPFRWFSFTEFYADPPVHFVTYSSDSLDVYFSERHAAGYRLRLRGITFNRYDGSLLHFGPIAFDFVGANAADRTAAGYAGSGKGAYHCATASFAVLSLVARSEPPRRMGF